MPNRKANHCHQSFVSTTQTLTDTWVEYHWRVTAFPSKTNEAKISLLIARSYFCLLLIRLNAPVRASPPTPDRRRLGLGLWPQGAGRFGAAQHPGRVSALYSLQSGGCARHYQQRAEAGRVLGVDGRGHQTVCAEKEGTRVRARVVISLVNCSFGSYLDSLFANRSLFS